MKILALALLTLCSNGASAQMAALEGTSPQQAAQAALQSIQTVADSMKAAAAAARFLNLMYDADLKTITAQTTESNGTVSLVLATIPGKKCELRMSKNPTANEHGWVVQTHQCVASSARAEKR